MLIGHLLPLSCYRKKLQNLSHHNYCPQIRHIWIQLITACGESCKKVYKTKHASLIWRNWNSDWKWSEPRWIMSSLQQPFVGGVVDSSRSVMRVLYTIFCNICHMLLSTGFKSGKFGGHSWGGINYGVFFLWQLNSSKCVMTFQGSVDWRHYSREMENTIIL